LQFRRPSLHRTISRQNTTPHRSRFWRQIAGL
jgi:hypothetical protein